CAWAVRRRPLVDRAYAGGHARESSRPASGHARASHRRRRRRRPGALARDGGGLSHQFAIEIRAAARWRLFLLQARNELGEVAGLVADVELVLEDAIPGIATCPRRAGQGEQVGPPGDTGDRP